VVLDYPRCRAACCFAALAQKLARARMDAPDVPGFFRKVVPWFC